MKPRLLIALLAATLSGSPAAMEAQQHPSVFFTARDVAAIRAGAAKYPLMKASLDAAKATMDSAFAHPMDVPQPGEAGGYAHERHK